MKKTIGWSLLAIAASTSHFAVSASGNTVFEKICAKDNIITTNTVTLGKRKRVTLHQNAMLQTITPVEDDNIAVKALFHRELNKLALPADCVEYLVHNSEVEQNSDNTIARVYFDFNKAHLTTESQNILTRITALIKEKDTAIQVEGHTDSVGTENYNLSLALERAKSTEEFLVQQGVDNDNLQVKSLGESEPIADNSTSSGRQLNRRVEIKTTQQQ